MTVAARSDPAVTARTYARALEQAMERLAGRPVVFSHRDWDLARRWHDDGVPLGLVLELLEDRGARAGRGLRSVASAVESAWSVVRAGELRPDPSPTASRPATDVPAENPYTAPNPDSGASIAELLRHAAARYRHGDPRSAIDADLDRALPGASPASWLDAAERDVETRLAAYRGRLPPREFDRVLARARIDALRARAGLPPSEAVRDGGRVG